jgi:HlyD family secretion protein
MRPRYWIPRLLLTAAVAGAIVVLRQTVLASPPIGVRAALLERGCVEETVTNSRAGTVKARRRAKLSPEIGGTVVAIPHLEGERVRKGDVLLRLDDSLPRARRELAEQERSAAAAQAEQSCIAAERASRELHRTEKLSADGLVSPDTLDQVQSLARVAEAACKAAAAGEERARAAVALARTELSKTLLRAPFDGIVADVSIEVGEWTTPSPPVMPVPAVIDVIDTSSIYVSAPMDEVDSGRIRRGLLARVSVDSRPGRSFPARVARVAPYVLDRVEQNRTLEIEADLADAEAAASLLPGTSADVEVILSVREDVVRLPTPALMEGGKVLVVEKDRLVERRVSIALKNWDWSEIASGVAAGEQVVLSLDRPEVKAGARVRVLEARRP